MKENMFLFFSCPACSFLSSDHSAAAAKRGSEGQLAACELSQSFYIYKMEIWHLGNGMTLKASTV